MLVGDEGADRWLFGVAVHHVAFDGWSQHLLAREIGLAYAARGTGALPASVQAAPPQTVPTPAQTYRLLQELTGAVDLAAQRAYWARNLAGIVPITWPASGDPADPGPRSVEYPLDDGLLARIAEAARRQGAGLLTVLLEAVSRAVSAHTGQDDFGVGVPVSRRSTEALQRPVSCLIDTVCVRLRRTADPDSGTKGTAGATGSRTDGTAHAVAGALANADLSFAEVVRVVRPARSRRHPLYQVIAAVQDSPAPVLEVAGCGTRIREQDDVRGHRPSCWCSCSTHLGNGRGCGSAVICRRWVSRRSPRWHATFSTSCTALPARNPAGVSASQHSGTAIVKIMIYGCSSSTSSLRGQWGRIPGSPESTASEGGSSCRGT